MVGKKGTIFEEGSYSGDGFLSSIGQGHLGGKAKSLFTMHEQLEGYKTREEFKNIDIEIPSMVVLKTGIFEQFMEQNNLYELAYSNATDAKIANAFQKASLPFSAVGDLRKFISKIKRPLAVRSSSLLEDAKFEPFAGIYGTKMIPNNQINADARFGKLTEAIKFVYASTFFSEAKEYMQATSHDIREERMGVVLQEVIGNPHGKTYYPEISGVARSYNFYPSSRAKPEQGVVNLALGLGKTIVDGGNSWNYSPAYPKISPPFGSINEMLKLTQKDFWAVNIGETPPYNPIAEKEFLTYNNITQAETDQTLGHIASTLDSHSGRVNLGVGQDGPRIINFAPILTMNTIPLNLLVKDLLKLCEKKFNSPVEIEFAMTVPPNSNSKEKARFGFLQVRPMVVSLEKVNIQSEELSGPNILLASKNVLGNGINNSITDILFVKPGEFEAKNTQKIAWELNLANKQLVTEKRPYLLIGFGRWGSSEPWLGIPVNWSQISGAKAIVEASLPQMNVDLSQGSHFFHNLTSFQVSYFSVPFATESPINWEWLNDQKVIHETDLIKQVRVTQPLLISVDGYRGIGLIKTN